MPDFFEIMRKLLPLILSLLPLVAYSAPMSESTCRKVAARFLAAETGGYDLNSLRLANEKNVTKDGADNNEFYVFDTPKNGFVIVAGDDSVTPIIAYSSNGRFIDGKSMTNFRWWMDIWARRISSNREKGVKATAAIRSEWDRYTKEGSARGSDGEGTVLETALWDQNYPYNSCCPKIDGGQAVTGCVATAMGILMKYFEWPVAGKGSAPAYTYKGYTIPAVKLGEEYDWKNMPISLSIRSSKVQKEAVATLLYHAGVIVESQYGTESTSAYSEEIRNALVTYMDYDKSATFKYANMYTDKEWINMIKDNIRETGPVLYGGASGEEGHQFLVTGYDSADRIYINWGWGGDNNGFYSYPGVGGFNEGNDALFNVKKNCGGKAQANIALYHLESSRNPGIKLSCTEVEKGVPFSATVESFWNTGAEDFNGEVGIAKVDSSDKILAVIKSGRISNLPANNAITRATFTACTLDTEAETGDKLMCVFKADGDSDWSICRYDKSDADLVGEIPLVDPFSIEQATRIYYTSTGILTITSKTGVTLKLIGPDGNDMTSIVSSAAGNWVIDSSGLRPAKYRILLTKGSEFKEISISMGLKK